MTDMTTMRFVSARRSAAMLGLVALCCVAPMRSASAQVAVYQNYYEEHKGVSCSAPGNSSCALIFSAAPQVVLITDVSCLITTNQTIQSAGFGVSDSASSAALLRRYQFFPPQLVSTGWYAASFKTNFLFGSGKYPVIFFNLTGEGTGGFDCKIVGTFQIP